MSWSVSANGPSIKVAEQIESQFNAMSSLAEPEETLKQSARKLIKDALAGNMPVRNVTVSAHGSQSRYKEMNDEKITNSISVIIS